MVQKNNLVHVVNQWSNFIPYMLCTDFLRGCSLNQSFNRNCFRLSNLHEITLFKFPRGVTVVTYVLHAKLHYLHTPKNMVHLDNVLKNSAICRDMKYILRTY